MNHPSYTTSTAFLEALTQTGVQYVFANLGSDHPGLVEAYARARAESTEDRFPRLVICPHESVAFSAAQGHAQISGRPQAVIVHVECGTQNIGGMIHNAAKGRVPVLVFAGASPATQHGEHTGSRNEFIQWIQDVHDQRGIVRGYTKYDNEIRTGANVKQIVHRAMQIATSHPAGPVYLVGAREVMEAPLDPATADNPAYHLNRYSPTAPAALDPATTRTIADALATAHNPLIVTSYLGRNPDAVPALVRLAEHLAVPVLESVPMRLNFPADHPLHAGYQWNTQAPNPVLARADTILAIDTDVPWIPLNNAPHPNARVFSIDTDPLKEQMPLWHIPAEVFARADAAIALEQITDHLTRHHTPDTDALHQRRTALAAEHRARRAELTAREQQDAPDGAINPAALVAQLRDLLADEQEEAIVLTEAISNYLTVNEHLRANRPGSLIGSGGGSLGWHAGAAIGAKLARPDALVVSLVGDGSYLFGVPASAQWVARRYNTPTLTVIFDNRGWKSPKLSTLGVHPDGVAAREDDFNVSFEPEADLPGIAAAAGGAHARTLTRAEELPGALKEALEAVRSGRSAVLSVHVPRV
ncbi:thiamine pyrophosphate-requiring protein [Streptomonospora nanhaiensis]|uniref:thiamine pyrophosphate-requiring protein n=1 Tax=Streptomonospora nanhaiensis TaxID=1323731 RepID=UPI001C991BCE|nr:thiamine pyrophosphate-requiring protein [Streptomonospora nanhaiensis]MBX9389247.1 thiamine pyrophosphate-requiring protein [Streptomonospora nanhaiensis]